MTVTFGKDNAPKQGDYWLRECNIPCNSKKPFRKVELVLVSATLHATFQRIFQALRNATCAEVVYGILYPYVIIKS